MLDAHVRYAATVRMTSNATNLLARGKCVLPVRMPATADTEEAEQAEEIVVCGVEGAIRIAEHASIGGTDNNDMYGGNLAVFIQ